MSDPMTLVLALLTLQCALGGFDNLWHHELQAKLPSQPGARAEVALHSARECVYGMILFSAGWLQWQGAWTYVLIGLLALEVLITLCDFVVEDRTRKLPESERVLHAVLAINYGAILALWTPVMMAWSREPTAIAWTQHGAWSWLMALFALGVFAWSVRNLLAVARLGVPQWQRNPLRMGASPAPRAVLVTGATGFIGGHLVRALVARGDRVIVLSRNVEKARDQFGPLVDVVGTLREIANNRQVDAIVNLAGEPLAGGLWTATRKRKFLDSRRDTTDALVALIARLHRKPRVLINGSAIGYYGHRPGELLDEDSDVGRGLLADICRHWEDAALQAGMDAVRVCRLRIGLVLGDGGVLKPMALGTRLGGGTVLGDGAQMTSWIHVDDLVRLIETLLARRDLAGAFNAVAPAPVSQREFTRQLARALHRPTLWRVPAGLLRGLLGEMSDLFLTDQNVQPRRALQAGFFFNHTQLAPALRSILGPEKPDERPIITYANEDCPVCSREMGLYKNAARRAGVLLGVCAVGREAHGLSVYGLTDDDLRRRLFVRRADGRLLSGMDAFIALWRRLPGYRWLAHLAALPGFHAFFEMIYSLICAPLLVAWNERRLRRLRALPSSHRQPGDQT